jgi:hypothetical protein
VIGVRSWGNEEVGRATCGEVPPLIWERYESDIRSARNGLRAVLRGAVPAAHFRPRIVTVASVIVGLLMGPVTEAPSAGAVPLLADLIHSN